MNVKLLYDRVLIRIIEPAKKTSGGLFMPDIALEGSPYRYGEIVEVGTGRIIANGTTIPLVITKGDLVMFFRDKTGEQLVVPMEGEDLLIAREVHVVMILDKETLQRSTGLLDASGDDVRVMTTSRPVLVSP